MRYKLLVSILIFLALMMPASPARGGGAVSVCDEIHVWAALVGGGTISFTCSGTINLTHTITFISNTTIDGSGQEITFKATLDYKHSMWTKESPLA